MDYFEDIWFFDYFCSFWNFSSCLPNTLYCTKWATDTCVFKVRKTYIFLFSLNASILPDLELMLPNLIPWIFSKLYEFPNRTVNQYNACWNWSERRGLHEASRKSNMILGCIRQVLLQTCGYIRQVWRNPLWVKWKLDKRYSIHQLLPFIPSFTNGL